MHSFMLTQLVHQVAGMRPSVRMGTVSHGTSVISSPSV